MSRRAASLQCDWLRSQWTLCRGAQCWTVSHCCLFVSSWSPSPFTENESPGSWMERGRHARPQLANMGEAAWPFLNSTLDVSLQWPAVLLQLMCAPPCEAFIGSVPHTHIHTHLLLWFCLNRLSHSPQTGVPPCSATASVERKKKCWLPKKKVVFMSRGFKFCAEAKSTPPKTNSSVCNTISLWLHALGTYHCCSNKKCVWTSLKQSDCRAGFSSGVIVICCSDEDKTGTDVSQDFQRTIKAERESLRWYQK